MLVIYNTPQNEQKSLTAPVSSENKIIWQGDSWEEFIKETGFDKSGLGGFYISNQELIENWHTDNMTGIQTKLEPTIKNTIGFSQNIKDDEIKRLGAFMTGPMLTSKIRSFFSNSTIGERAVLLAPIATIFNTVEADTTFTEVEFGQALTIIESIMQQSGLVPNDKIVNLYNLLVQWGRSFRFYTEE